MTKMMPVRFLKFVLYAMIAFFEEDRVEARSYIETNEVTYKVDERAMQQPICPAESICGYLQANVRGINYQRLCTCPGGLSSCPMSWDSDDGHSVTQGSDQYKFCDRPPTLTTCEPNQTAYSSRMVYLKGSEELKAKSDNLHCVCPEDHNYVLAHQNWDEPDPDSESVEFFYTCALLPLCRMGDTCKTLSEKGPEFLVNRKCRCPDGLRCPTLTSHGVKSFELGNGRVDMLRCQH